MIAAMGWYEYQTNKESALDDCSWDAYSRYQFEKYMVSKNS
jgi:hypothetical protein